MPTPGSLGSWYQDQGAEQHSGVLGWAGCALKGAGRDIHERESGAGEKGSALPGPPEAGSGPAVGVSQGHLKAAAVKHKAGPQFLLVEVTVGGQRGEQFLEQQ